MRTIFLSARVRSKQLINKGLASKLGVRVAGLLCLCPLLGRGPQIEAVLVQGGGRVEIPLGCAAPPYMALIELECPRAGQASQPKTQVWF